MKTKTIGEILRDERMLHGLSITELSRKTRIKESYLKALEKNDFSIMPAAIFVKGYIKAYAQLFGFEAEPLLRLLRRDYKESAKGTLVPREFIKPVLKKRLLQTPVSAALMLIGGFFFAVLLYVSAQWYFLNKPPALEVTTPSEDAVVSAQVEVMGSTDPEAVVSVNAQPVALQQDGSFETVIFIPREGVSTVTIEARDRRGKTTVIQRTVTVDF